MKLGTYVARRLILAIPVLVGVTMLTFSISWVANEGHMERAYLTEKMTPTQRQQIVEQYGFDEPAHVQYLSYLKRLVTLDLGFSRVENDRTVIEVYGEYLPATLELTLAAMLVAVTAGIGLGTLTAVRKDAPVDHAIRFFALSGVSVPVFWLGLVLKFAFATTYPVELLRAASPFAKGVFLSAAALVPVALGVFVAEGLDAPRLGWRRYAWHVGTYAVVAVVLLRLGWTFLGGGLALVAFTGYSAVAVLKLLRRQRFTRRMWQGVLGGTVAVSFILAASPVGTAASEVVFGIVPDLPLGGRFSNDLVFDEHAHPSLTDGPTRLLLVDTALARDWVAFDDVVKHLILPGVTLGYASMAVIARMMRSSMLETLHLDFVRTARAKGLPEHQVVARHARRNALIPVATVVGLAFGGLLSGAVLTETIFQWPGLGRWSTKAIVASDTTSIMSFTLLVVVIYLVANFVVDVVYGILDPRVRLQ